MSISVILVAHARNALTTHRTLDQTNDNHAQMRSNNTNDIVECRVEKDDLPVFALTEAEATAAVKAAAATAAQKKKQQQRRRSLSKEQKRNCNNRQHWMHLQSRRAMIHLRLYRL